MYEKEQERYERAIDRDFHTESEDELSTLQQARIRTERRYIENLQEGRHLRKNGNQIKVLLEYFEKTQVWDYPTKIKIAEELGMTLSQVSKWNWDHRKKMGVSTQRIRTSKKQN